MESIPLVVLLVALVASRPFVARLWRTGRLSDRAAAVLILARFPLVCFAGAWLSGGSPLFIAGISALGLLPSALFYRFMLDRLQKLDRERADAA